MENLSNHDADNEISRMNSPGKRSKHLVHDPLFLDGEGGVCGGLFVSMSDNGITT